MALFQINNFGGNLTRKSFGTMNSGLARIGKSHSQDPFNKVSSVMFNETATNLDPSHSTVKDVLVDGDLNEESGILYIYAVDRSGTVYKINTSTDAISVVTNTLNISLAFGGGIRVIYPGGQQKLIITHNTGYVVMFTDGTGVAHNTVPTDFQGQFGDVDVTDSLLNVNTSSEPISINQYDSAYTGQPVVWTTPSGESVVPLISGNTYYLIIKGNFQVQLALTASDAMKGVFIPFVSASNPLAWDLNGSGWIPNIPHPISDEYFGGIFMGNGFNLVDYAISSGTANNSRLNPTFPQNYTINAIEIDGQGRYMRINGTTGTAQDIITTDPIAQTQTPKARSLYWNGIDDSYDSYDAFVQSNTSALNSFIGSDMVFGQDFWGGSIYQNNGGAPDKMLALREVRSPLPGAITSTSNLLVFGAPYYSQNVWRCGIFGIGTLDDQDQPSIYSLLGIPATTNNTICTQVGMLKLAQNRMIKSDGTVLTNSKFYVSTYETGGTAAANLYSFNLTPNAGTVNNGVYETQKEKFQLQQAIDRVAFYVNPTQTGVSFRLDLIDVDDTIPTNGSFTYTYSSGVGDETQMQGTLEVFEWSALQMKNLQALGLRITNLGTVQPGINQIYIETHDTDKAASQPAQQTP